MAPRATITMRKKRKSQGPPEEPWDWDEKASGWTSKISVSPTSEKRPWKWKNGFFGLLLGVFGDLKYFFTLFIRKK